MTIYSENKNQYDLYTNVLIAINLTFSQVNRRLSQQQIELNQEKWGNPNWVYFIQKSYFEDIKLTDQYFVINTKNSIGSIEIDGEEYPVESKLYFSMYFIHKLNDDIWNKSSDSVELCIEEYLIYLDLSDTLF